MLKDCDFGAGASRDVRELRSDVAPADEHDVLRQAFKIEERLVVDEMLLARDAKRYRLRARRDQDVVGFNRFSLNVQRVRPREPGAAMERVYAFLGESAPALFGAPDR